MRSNASERFQIVNEPDFNQSSIAWSPDSQVIVYNRFNQSDLAQPVEIWLVNIEEKIPQEVIAGGYSPQWIP
jgi:Tol biopolymer transport system component